MNDQSFQLPPPPPNSNSNPNDTKSPPNPNRRQLFSSRMRTASNGSTRGAFGIMPVDASAHDPEDIYQRQQHAAAKRKSRIGGAAAAASGGGGTNSGGNHGAEDGMAGQGSSMNHHRGRDGATAAGTNAHPGYAYHNPTTSKKKERQSALPTPGQTINRDSGNLAQIARDAIRNDLDEEWGNNSRNYGGLGMSGSGNGNTRTNHDPHQKYPRNPQQYPQNQQQQQQQQQQFTDIAKVYASWSKLPSPPSQSSNHHMPRYQSNSTKESSLNYSYPSEVFSNHPLDRDLLGAAKQDANRGNIGNDIIDNIPTSTNQNLPSVEHKTLDSRSVYSSEYEEEEPLTWFQYLIYHHHEPEFTTAQQYVWAILIGILMGVFTAIWGEVIEFCVEFTWKTIPEYLLEIGVFTDLEGSFPLPYYMVLCPAVFGGVSSADIESSVFFVD